MNLPAFLPENLRTIPFVLVSPWSNQPRKNWPLERFEELCRWLVQEKKILCIIIGGTHAGPPFSPAFFSAQVPVIDATGKLTFPEVLELLPSAALTVGNDSALGHYAALFNIPSLILFSAAHSIATWVPQSGNYICLQAQVPCRLCSFRIDDCDHDYECMKSLDLELAKSACTRLLSHREN